MLSVILGLVDTALANKDGVQELAWQATDLMDLILESQAELEKPGAFVRIMQRFKELLKEIELYATQYSDRNVLIRIVMSTGDESYRQELLGKLQELRGNAALAFAVKTHTAVLEVHALAIKTEAKVATTADGMALLLVSAGVWVHQCQLARTLIWCPDISLTGRGTVQALRRRVSEFSWPSKNWAARRRSWQAERNKES